MESPWKKRYDQLNVNFNVNLLKSTDITLPTKVCGVKAMVFPEVVYGWESWSIKKTEHQRIETFEP